MARPLPRRYGEILEPQPVAVSGGLQLRSPPRPGSERCHIGGGKRAILRGAHQKTFHLNDIDAAWGSDPVASLTPVDVQKAIDASKSTPSAGRVFRSALSRLCSWGIPRGYTFRWWTARQGPVVATRGGAGAPCPICDAAAGETPRMPEGSKTELDKDGWRH